MVILTYPVVGVNGADVGVGGLSDMINGLEGYDYVVGYEKCVDRRRLETPEDVGLHVEDNCGRTNISLIGTRELACKVADDLIEKINGLNMF